MVGFSEVKATHWGILFTFISDSLFKSAPYCNNICWVLYQKKSNNVYVFPILILTEKFFKLSANVFCLFFLVVHGQIWFSTWFSTEPVWH